MAWMPIWTMRLMLGEIEIKRRVEEIEAGTAKGTPADEVFDRLRLKAKSP